MRTTLTLFLLFTIFSVADDILLDAAFRCWNAETDGVVGDIGALSSVTDDSDPGYTLVFRVDFGRTISELAYTKFQISSPFQIGNTFRGFTPAQSAKTKLDLETFELNFRNLIYEDEYVSLRWAYGLTVLDLQNTVHDSLANRANMNVSGYIPMLGLEGEWYWKRDLSLRSHVRFGDLNIGSDDVRIKDIELGLVYMPYDAFNVELGYKNYSLDVSDTSAGITTILEQNLKGPYTQINWLF
jgi:hypothetical protein